MNAVRIIAAILVVLSHVRPLFFVDFSDAAEHGPLTQLMYAVTSLGHPAVIVFFVLSGYWVGGSVLRSTTGGRFRVGPYAVARLVRLWIVLIPALLLTQIVDHLGASLRPTSDIYLGSEAYHMNVSVGGPTTELGVVDTLGNIFFVQDVYVPTLGTNGPLWSLASEFWYYLLFPALLLAVLPRTGIRARVTSILVAAAAILLLTFATVPNPTPILFQFPAWIIGALLAWQSGRVVRIAGGLPGGVLVTLRIAATLITFGCAVLSRDASLWAEYLLALAATFMLATFIVDAHSRGARAVLAPFSWSAEWSFSLYATHLPVLMFLAAVIIPDAANRMQMTISTFPLLFAIAVVPVVVAMCLYTGTEKHTNRARAWVSKVLRIAPARTTVPNT
jgi:peptidoglycan/LPS O-acetylase OafA/YrhL